MGKIPQAEQYLLEQIRRGDNEAWSQLVDRYHGRLLHFAQAKLSQRADCEDIVQETFISFLSSLDSYRHDCVFETYLFTILRRKIIDSYRKKQSKNVGLIQDIYRTTRYGEPCDAFENLPAADHTGSWYVRRDEQCHLQREALSEALLELVNDFKKSLNFRDLEIVELIFYCHLSNRDTAAIMDMKENNISTIKYRCLKKVRDSVAKSKMSTEPLSDNFENLLNEVWQQHRLSCPKRSTIGAYLLETLDRDWHCYVDFHLKKIGCHFCQANLEDLQRQTAEDTTSDLHTRIMESTAGFLRKP